MMWPETYIFSDVVTFCVNVDTVSERKAFIKLGKEIIQMLDVSSSSTLRGRDYFLFMRARKEPLSSRVPIF